MLRSAVPGPLGLSSGSKRLGPDPLVVKKQFRALVVRGNSEGVDDCRDQL